MSFPNTINATASSQAHTNVTTAQKYPVGQKLEYEDGRIFRYVRWAASGTLAVLGEICQGAAIVATDVDRPLTTAAVVGDTSIAITAQGSAAADFYKDGWAVAQKGTTAATQQSFAHKIDTHILLAAATRTIEFFSDYPIRVAKDTTNGEFNLSPSAYRGVIVAATTITNLIPGVQCTTGTADSFGWVQTGGIIGVRFVNLTTVVNQNVEALLASAGFGGLTSADVLQTIGQFAHGHTTATGETQAVFLTLDT